MKRAILGLALDSALADFGLEDFVVLNLDSQRRKAAR